MKKNSRIIKIGDVEFKVLYPELLPKVKADEYERLKDSIKDVGVLVPVLSGKGHTILYRSHSYNYVRRILGNPIYAGAYVFGRRQVEEVLDAFVDGDAGAEGEDENGDDETPEVDFLAVAEGVVLVGGLLCLTQAEEEQCLVAGVDDGVDGFA